MSKASKRRKIRLDQVRPAYEEALGTENAQYEFEGTDGADYSFKHPAFFGKAETDELDEAESPEEIAQVLLGDQYDAFVDGGNSVEDLMLLFATVGAEYREKAPKVRISR